MRAIAADFPAQLGRASLKLPVGCRAEVVARRHFPAQLGRASLKRELARPDRPPIHPISRPNWAGPH